MHGSLIRLTDKLEATADGRATASTRSGAAWRGAGWEYCTIIAKGIRLSILHAPCVKHMKIFLPGVSTLVYSYVLAIFVLRYPPK